MALSLWLSLALVCMMGAMSLGPSLAAVLNHILNGGMKNGMLAALSHGFGVGLYAEQWKKRVVTWLLLRLTKALFTTR